MQSAEQEILKKSSLFHGLAEEEIERLLQCLGCFTRSAAPGEMIWMAQDTVDRAGIVLEGEVSAEKCGYGGARALIARHGPGEMFGDVLMTTSDARSPVDVLAGPHGARILFVPFAQIMTDCARRCPCHAALRLNLLHEISQKFWAMRRRMECLSSPTLRGKLCLLLLNAGEDARADSFFLPYDRAGMAAYLGVNRTALSRELSRMRDEGLIVYRRNWFQLRKKSLLTSFLD